MYIDIPIPFEVLPKVDPIDYIAINFERWLVYLGFQTIGFVYLQMATPIIIPRSLNSMDVVNRPTVNAVVSNRK